MAKRTNRPPPAPKPDAVNEVLLEFAEMVLSDFFFDPENEQAYKRTLSKNRSTGHQGVLLNEATVALPDAECVLRIEALRTLTHFRVTVTHPQFATTVEGAWSFESEELNHVRYTRTGDRGTIERTLDAMFDAVEGVEPDDDETFADLLDGSNEEGGLIGDDPTAPPEATALDRSRLKAIAKRIARRPDIEIATEDRGWLEQTPQILPVVAESLIAAASAAKRDEVLVGVYQHLLALELEFVRYRQDRGWDWANAMLDAFQERLVAVGKAGVVPREDWFVMCSALIDARVPVDDDVQAALADAGFQPEEVDAPPEEMLRMVRHFMDDLARMVSSPFEVVDALKGSGAMLPAMLRSFMATELALSPHQILRDAVPLLLLDNEPTVRAAAAGALEQTARADTMSPDNHNPQLDPGFRPPTARCRGSQGSAGWG
jgi:hypothetical protein